MGNKRRLLVSGKHTITVDSIFSHFTEDYDVISTSLRPDDVKAHFDLFRPDVFLICMGNSSQEETEQYVEIKKLLGKTKVKIVLISDRDIAEAVQGATGNFAALVIRRPATVSTIKENLEQFFEQSAMTNEPEIEDDEADEGRKIVHGRNGVVPLDEPTEEPKKPEEPPLEHANGEPTKAPEAEAARRRILVVDDDPMMLKMLKEQLKDEFDVATAINGKLAINFLKSRSADLILLDYEMPDESGADVIKKIRSNPDTENIPVLFLTGVTDKNKIREIVQYKPQGYIVKPVSKNKLITTVKNTLENKE